MLKTVLNTLDGVDDAQKPFYAESDGKFILQVDGIDDHPEVVSLKNAYARTKADKQNAADEAKNLKAQIAELQKGAPDTAATQAKISALQDQLSAKEAEVGEWRGKYTGVTRDQSLTSALQGVGITEPAFVKAATAMLAGQVKLGDDGTALVETSMGPKLLGEFVKGWAAGEGKAFVSKPQGGGAQPASETGGKTISASQLDGMTPQEKAAFYKANPGVKVV
jgi:hypothetical protein